jgi:glyceraldehyde 3-phosphate dehydrogenase
MTKKLRVAINGFGRIGRLTARNLINKHSDKVDIVAVNDLTTPENLAYLFKFDSTYRIFEKPVEVVDGGNLKIGDEIIKVLAEREPAKLPWKDMDIDVVLECTGRFLSKELASLHLSAGAKKVVLSAPAKDKEILTVVQGVNVPSIYYEEGDFADTDNLSKAQIVSNASCTTNCVAPALKVLSRNFDLINTSAITVHAYTATQMLQDGPSMKDFRDGRAAAANMIPSKTGAAKAVALVLPELEGKLMLSSIRVPVITGSMVYLVANLASDTSVEEVNAAFKKSTESYNKNILEYSTDEIVSSDIIQNSHSSILDSTLTEVSGKTVKLVLWYDNEWGYSNRLAELCAA